MDALRHRIPIRFDDDRAPRLRLARESMPARASCGATGRRVAVGLLAVVGLAAAVRWLPGEIRYRVVRWQDRRRAYTEFLQNQPYDAEAEEDGEPG